MNDLLENIKILVASFKKIRSAIIIESIKNKKIREVLKETNEIKKTIENILVNLKDLESLNPNIFICYENNIYLSVEGGKYVVSKNKIENGESYDVEILKTTKKLQKALEYFYNYAYKKNIKKLD